MKMYAKYSTSSISRYAKLPVNLVIGDGKFLSKSCPSLIVKGQGHSLISVIATLHKTSCILQPPFNISVTGCCSLSIVKASNFDKLVKKKQKKILDKRSNPLFR